MSTTPSPSPAENTDLAAARIARLKMILGVERAGGLLTDPSASLNITQFQSMFDLEDPLEKKLVEAVLAFRAAYHTLLVTINETKREIE